MALRAGDVVVIVGLEAATQHNHASAVVVGDGGDGGRVAVRRLHGPRPLLAVRRRHLLRAADDGDRRRLFARVAWARQLELRCAARWLEAQLPEALCLRVAACFAPRETLALTSGFAAGRVVPRWTAFAPGRGWVASHDPEGPQRLHGAAAVADGVERIDCAVVDAGGGRFVVAGGCGDHPSRCDRFFRSAFLYDGLAGSAAPLPDMPRARHGCGGARVGRRVYVVGGDYCDRGPGRCLGSVLDLDAPGAWAPLPATAHPAERDGGGSCDELAHVAFAPVAAVAGRLVVLANGRAKAWNPLDPRGWRTVGGGGVGGVVGTSAQGSCVWRDRLVVAQGRGAASAGCAVVALQFSEPPTSDDWAAGDWADLGSAATGGAGRVGCDLAVVHDRLYVSGGVDEATHAFDASVARFDYTYRQLDDIFRARAPDDQLRGRATFTAVDALALPQAMHAHSSITVPLMPN